MIRMLLIDVANLVFREHHAIKTPLSDKQGRPTGALYGAVKSVMALRRQYPSIYGACLCDGGSRRRRALYPDYKGNRPPPPEGLPWQMEQFAPWASALGWPVCRVPGEEADDLMATLATTMRPADVDEVLMATGDKDLNQLLRDGIRRLDKPRGVNGYVPFLARQVMQKYGVTPEQFGDYLAMVGDTSDNIPGVNGIGPKGAAALLEQFGDLSRILDAPTGENRLVDRVHELSADAVLSRKLVTLDTAVSIPGVTPVWLRLRSPDRTLCSRLCDQFSFGSLTPLFTTAGQGSAEPSHLSQL